MQVKASFVDLEAPTGVMRTYLYEPVYFGVQHTAPISALILYSEIFQQTAPIKRLACQFASAGYFVCVPEIYHQFECPGVVLNYDEEGRNRGNAHKLAMSLNDFDSDTTALIKYLQNHPRCNGKMGAVGFCIGGHLAFRAATHPQVQAAACFYATNLHTGKVEEKGYADTLQRQAAKIKGELLMIWGRQDPHVSKEGRGQIYSALEQFNLNFTWHEFNGAHAFMRDEGERYDPALARTGMNLAFDLFTSQL